jgi:hypothetical protein
MAFLNQSQVPEGMVGRVPWGVPFSRWSQTMLERGLDVVAPRENPKDENSKRHADPFFPTLVREISAELATR